MKSIPESSIHKTVRNPCHEIELSVVAPVYCEADSLPELTDRLIKVLNELYPHGAYEIVYVDDGSRDVSPAIIKNLANVNPNIKGVLLRHNCGKALALMAGFRHAKGKLVVTIDSDLQDSPEDIPILRSKLNEGYDVVVGRRAKRRDTLFRKLGSKIYNTTVSKSSGLRIHDMNCGFKIYKREVTSSLCVYGDFHRYIPLQAHFLGFRVSEADVSNDARKYGSSRYPALRYQGLFDLLSILFLNRFAFSPLHFFGIAGLSLFVPSLTILMFLIGRHILGLVGFLTEFPLLRPMLQLSLTMLILGFLILMSGFICDFVLHHHIRNRIDDIISLKTDQVVGENVFSETLT